MNDISLYADKTPMAYEKDELKATLAPELYRVACEGGTEAPFTGKYVHTDERGMYVCAVCGNPLFNSETKFDSGTGWPSFWEAADPAAVTYRTDTSLGMERTEVVCAKCGSHLGHVFDDGPMPTGKRFCINSVSLDLKKED